MPSDTKSSALWWEVEASDPDELAKRLAAFTQLNYTTADGADDFYLAWAYQRDYLIQRFGGLQRALSFGPGGGVGGHFGWLANEKSVPSPNIVKSVVDTAAAWLVAEAPPLACRASGAGFEQQPALERYGCALDSMFNAPKVARIMEEVGRDGLLRGVGWAMPAYEQGEVVMRRLLPWQVVTDPVDARHGNPRSCVVRTTMDRQSLIQWMREQELDDLDRLIKEVEAIPATYPQVLGDRGHWTVYDYELDDLHDAHAADHVVVWYAWHASTTVRAGDGRYVLAASNELQGGQATILVDEEYEPAHVAPLSWSPYPNDEGITGTGLGHLMIPWQEALDRSFFKLQRSLDKYGHIKILVPSSVMGQLNLQSFSEAGMTVLEIPESMNADRALVKTYDPKVLRSEDIEWIERILQWSASTYGINQLMQSGVGGAVPSASAVALAERADQSQDRFSDVTRRWTEFRLGCGDRLLRFLDGVLEVNPDYAATYEVRGGPRKDTWKDLTSQVETSAITLEVRGNAAVSRSGRLARAQEWGDRGFLSPDELREIMLDDPDLRKAARESLAPYRLVESQIQGVIEAKGGDWWAYQPDEDTPLELAIAKAGAVIQIAKTQGAKVETIERLREYRLLAEMLLEQQTPAAPMGMPGMTPGPAPGPEMAMPATPAIPGPQPGPI